MWINIKNNLQIKKNILTGHVRFGVFFYNFCSFIITLTIIKIFLYKKNSAYLLSTNIYPKGGQLLLLASEWVSSRRMIWNLVIDGLFISDSLKLNLILFKGVTLSMHFLLRWSAANGDTRESICDYLVVDKKQSCRHQNYFMTSRPENIQASTFFKYSCHI